MSNVTGNVIRIFGVRRSEQAHRLANQLFEFANAITADGDTEFAADVRVAGRFMAQLETELQAREKARLHRR